MTVETFQTAQDLTRKMASLIAEKNLWESSIGMDKRISGIWVKDRYGLCNLSAEFVPFQILKTIVLDHYYKEISKLESEFNGL